MGVIATKTYGNMIVTMQIPLMPWMTNLRSHGAVCRRNNDISTLVGNALEDNGLVEFASAAQSARWRKHGGVVTLVGEYRHNDHYERQ